jgi:hypothetical protein
MLISDSQQLSQFSWRTKTMPTPEQLRNKAQELRAKLAQQQEEVAALKEYFSSLFPEEYMVPDSQFGVWIRQYGFDNAVVGFEEAATKINKVNQAIEEGVFDKQGNPVDIEPFNKLSLVKFASWVMSQEKKKEQ